MKKVLFLGYLVPTNIEGELSGLSVAGNRMQWNIIKHLAADAEIEVECLSVLPVAAFPKDKQLYVKSRELDFGGLFPAASTAFCNLPVIKQIWQTLAMYRAAYKIVKKAPDVTVLCFNLFPQIGVPMRWLQRKHRNLDTVAILADLPIDDDTKRKGFSLWLRKRFDASTWRSISACKRFVVLNEQVAKLYTKGKPYIVVDGGVDESKIAEYCQPKEMPKEKNILYCGALTEYNGILNLLKAMKKVEHADMYLDIYGGGYLEDEVKKAAAQDKRIRYHGRVSNNEVLKRQKEAWLLINPRAISDPISQVTFPSKTFEYLLSQTPVLTTKLNGYGAEYQDTMLFMEDSVQGIVKAMETAYKMQYEDLLAYGERGYRFVIDKRLWEYQAKRIGKFLTIF